MSKTNEYVKPKTKVSKETRVTRWYEKQEETGVTFRGKRICKAGVFWNELKDIAFNDLDNGRYSEMDVWTRQWFVLKNPHDKIKKGFCHYCQTQGRVDCLYNNVRVDPTAFEIKMSERQVNTYCKWGLTRRKDKVIPMNN